MTALKKGLVGIIEFTLQNSNGDILDQTNGEPMPYLHGYQNVIPGLENALEGKVVGEQFTVEIPPAQGYGEKKTVQSERIHQNQFSKEHLDSLVEGSPIHLETRDGKHITLFVEKKQGAYVYLTPNHPLAGEVLHFDIKVVNIRAALPEELAHGHPHGIDGTAGHHH